MKASGGATVICTSCADTPPTARCSILTINASLRPEADIRVVLATAFAPSVEASCSEMTDPFDPVSSMNDTGPMPLTIAGTIMAPWAVK